MALTANRIEVQDPSGYIAKLLGLLGQRDPLKVLGQTPDVLRQIVAAHPAAAFHARPFEGKWTPCEILGHLLDTEVVFGFRVRHILAEDRPTIIGMDQELWVAAQKYNEREPRELVEAFAAFRGENLRLWRRITPDQLQREGRHSERGNESLGLMLKMEAGHDLSHIDQIDRYIAAVKSGK